MIVNTGGRTDTVQYYTYWLLNRFSEDQGLEYVTNDVSMSRPFDAPPIVVNYFYHERIRKSSRS